MAGRPGGRALGLAEVFHALGRRAEAAATLEAAIDASGQSLPMDPFRSYGAGDRAEQRQWLEAVKVMVRRPKRVR